MGLLTTVNQYALLRFIAGIGLAGELGAGITLVSESLPTKVAWVWYNPGCYGWPIGSRVRQLCCKDF
jgi:MFS family permease